MNNIFKIHEILNDEDIKQKYTYLKRNIQNKDTIQLNRDDTISLLDIEYNLSELIIQIDNIEYLLFANITECGGLGAYMNLLKSDSYIVDKDQDIIYSKLHNMVILNKEINNPLCNCCLTECDKDPSISNWMTSSTECKELYYDETTKKTYTSHNYLHICNSCNILLQLKLKKYYNNLNLVPMTYNEFNKQTSGFMKYQSLIFNLLFNYDINSIKEVLNNRK